MSSPLIGAQSQRPCFVHIGTHKTGTTSIQAFLAANRDRLHDHGLFVPRSAGKGEPAFACHHGIVGQLRGQSAATVHGTLDSVLAELHGSDAPRSCLSSEDFSLLHDRPALLERLRDGIRAAGFAPKIVVYLRPQASYGIAIYAANVLSGYRLPFDAFLRDIIGEGHYRWDGGIGPPLDYTDLLEPFQVVFGRDAIHVCRFRSDAPDTALLASFLAIVLGRDARLDAFTIPAKRANRTLTFSAVLETLGDRNDLDEHVRFAPLTLGALARLWLRFSGSNRRLRAAYGIRVPVFEPLDIVRAIPIRRTPALTRQLWRARAMLRGATPDR